MLRLDKVSKFYSSDGVVTSGFSKVSLDFNIGEFVAITGESGSGKSTLLNVISGLDSYEEGEMYIFEQPTSGYGSEDMESYRKRFIGNIFQTFNLINNYTVYQNIELVLLLSGYKKNEIKARVLDLIDRVGLNEYRNTKASKLSGGQKQRVAIARALAKDTPIIVADEPTGNLDVKSAEGIIELLASLSKDRLIIIVTHNYEQVEKYVTRKITMRDGKLSEDKHFDDNSLEEARAKTKSITEIDSGNKHFREAEKKGKQKSDLPSSELVREARHDGLRFDNMVRLGTRNTFSLPMKLLLLLFVFIFLCSGTAMSYGTMQNMRLAVREISFNSIFADANSKRVIVTKPDRSAFSEEDYAKLANISNVKSVDKYSLLMDHTFSFSSMAFDEQLKASENANGGDVNANPENPDAAQNQIYLTLKARSLEGMKKRLAAGRMPEGANEAIILINKSNEYMLPIENMIDKELFYQPEMAMPSQLTEKGVIVNYAEGIRDSVKIVGYGYMTNEESKKSQFSSQYFDGYVCCQDSTLTHMQSIITSSKAKLEVKANKTTMMVNPSMPHPVIASPHVEEGSAYIPESIAQEFPYGNTGGKTLDFTIQRNGVRNLSVKIGAVYRSGNANWLLGKSIDDLNREAIYLNEKDIRSLYEDGQNFQVTVNIEENKYAGETLSKIEKLGYKALYLYSASNDEMEAATVILSGMRKVILVILLTVLFFITYFIIKLIFKSRTVYFSTVRMLGGSRRACSGMLLTEILVVFHIAFAVIAGIIIKVKDGTINSINFLERSFLHIENIDIAIIYVIILIMAIFLAIRYSSQMFRKTAMNAYKEEV